MKQGLRYLRRKKHLLKKQENIFTKYVSITNIKLLEEMKKEFPTNPVFNLYQD